MGACKSCSGTQWSKEREREGVEKIIPKKVSESKDDKWDNKKEEGGKKLKLSYFL